MKRDPVSFVIWLVFVLGLTAVIAAVVTVGLWLGRADAAERVRLQRGELEILARVVQAEATGEPEAGKRGVAWTVVNRMARPEIYGATVTKVILAPYQYAKPLPLNDNSEAFLRALLATVQVLLATVPDDSLGATHFLRCDMRRPPRWTMTYQRTAKIGSHCFYRAAR